MSGVAVMVGYPDYTDDAIYNAAALIRDGKVLANYHKQELPNYLRLRREALLQARAARAASSSCKGIRVGLLICEDVWEPNPGARRVRRGRAAARRDQRLAVLDAVSAASRRHASRARIKDTGLPVVYVNMLGGQDELIFDGGSFVMNAAGEVVQRAPPFKEGSVRGRYRPRSTARPCRDRVTSSRELSEEASVYNALVLGVRDYVSKHRFPGVVLGLSGGIDSALTLAIAVDALGADRVRAVMMPSRYTSQMSLDDAAEQARTLGVGYDVISIEGMFEAALGALQEVFAGRAPDTTEENIQARCRGLLLMAISNKTGRMVLTTGNKSEMAVGYATLYGDMAGGFAPIKDCSKMLVYRLAHYRNSIAQVIPPRVIERAPSAELRHDQKDSDSLPPYEVLDAILELFIEDNLSVDEISSRGFDRATVGRVLEMVKRNEYKRRQAPPGVRISDRAFGRDWRYPITSGYRTR